MASVDKKSCRVLAVAGVIIAATAITVATFGAGSAVGVAAITATATLAARATEVAVLEAKKSSSEGKSKKKIAINVFESIYDNGKRISGCTPYTKGLGILGKKLSVTKSVNQVKFSVKPTKFLKAIAKPASKLKFLAYAGVAYNWGNTIYSAFSKNPLKRTQERKYRLK